MAEHRIFIQRLPGWDSEAHELLVELKSALDLDRLQTLRVITGYEISGLSRDELDLAAPGLFYEKPRDELLWSLPEAGRTVAREFLPGQYDQRADSASRGLRLLFPDHRIEVKRFDVFLLNREISDQDISRIERWLINPVDSRAKNLQIFSLGEKAGVPSDVPEIGGFRDMNEAALETLKGDYGLALGIDDLLFIKSWYSEKENRDPTVAELKALDTYWSDHCRHTTFETELTGILVEDGPVAAEIRGAIGEWDEAREATERTQKPKTLMDLATIAGREARQSGVLDDWDLSEEINACTLKVDALIDGKRVPWLLSFKNETHNHPTEIEPYGGASTCLGGAVRDPLSGRAYVHQAVRVSGGADPRQKSSDVMPGKLPQRLIAHGAAEGYAGYGNQLGLPCTVVRESYHPNYAAKRLECGAVMGASPAEHVVREQPEAGDVVILVGGATGRDGIGGATGSSVAHDGGSLEKAGAEVQKGNPPEERKLQRLFRNPQAARLIKRCNDFGAGGVAVAVGELAEGLNINLDAVPVKYAGLDGLELALSESQERMAVVVEADTADEFIGLAESENLQAVRVATVSEDRRLLMLWRGSPVVDLSRDLLDTNGVRRRAEARISRRRTEIFGSRPADMVIQKARESSASVFQTLGNLLGSPEIASRKGLEERFDGSVGGTTVLASHGGKHQRTPAEASVQLLPADGRVETAGLMAVGFDPYLSAADPFRGGQYALIEALSRAAAVGGDWRKVRFSLQEFFGRTDRGDEAWGKPLAALLGALSVQRRWQLPAIGGKDSMSGSFEDMDVPPTIIAFAASALSADRVLPAALPSSKLNVALLKGCESGEKPDFDRLAANWDFLGALGKEGRIKASASVGPGGWPVKLTLMALGNAIGVDISAEASLDAFHTTYGGLLIASDLSAAELISRSESCGASLSMIGETIDHARLLWNGDSIDLAEAESHWFGTYEEVWPRIAEEPESIDSADAAAGELPAGRFGEPPSRSSLHIAAPRVCIPVFPGTNGEDDARRAFARQGALPSEHVFRDRDPRRLDEELSRLADSIAESQILFVSGGFSAGDEPDGAGKYIAAILRQPRISDAIESLLDKGGLVLGICNGFQALIKSGWLVDGKPGIPEAHHPTLTGNTIGRHVAKVVRTRALASDSPWLSKIEPGDRHSIPVSHGEGRFVAPPEVMNQLFADKRVVFQYCDLEGAPSMSGEYNPNGSMMAVEGIVSPCGRILGKMGHSERWRPGTFIDVPGMEIEQPLIAGGVEWLRS